MPPFPIPPTLCLPSQVDPYDFTEPRQILPDLKPEFWEGLESKKWSDRKASLTKLRELATYPRLGSADYGDVNRCAAGRRAGGWAGLLPGWLPCAGWLSVCLCGLWRCRQVRGRWLNGLAAGLVGWLAARLVGWLVGWLPGPGRRQQVQGRRAGRLGWLLGWLPG